MVNLPEDVMWDICVRLPVKSVGRFRCVNKCWYKLLNDRKFVQEHQHRAAQLNIDTTTSRGRVSRTRAGIATAEAILADVGVRSFRGGRGPPPVTIVALYFTTIFFLGAPAVLVFRIELINQ